MQCNTRHACVRLLTREASTKSAQSITDFSHIEKGNLEMKRILAGLVAAAFSVSMAMAADDPMASRYGNTVVAKGADGKEIGRTYYNADGTYERSTPAGKSKGTWKMDGGKLCLTQTEPAPPAAQGTVCLPFPGPKKVGDSWEVTLPDGAKATATLQQGRP
jgi:hypothetical protein